MAAKWSRRRRVVAESAESLAGWAFNRYCAWRRMHPMSGGVGRVRRDGVADYIALRRAAFGFDLAPLPRSLQLPAADGRPGRALVPAPADEPALSG